MKLYKLLFIKLMVIGTLISISSYSWMSMWMGLEINLLSIIPLFASDKTMKSSEASLKYFITQALASMALLMAVILISMESDYMIPHMYSPSMLILNSALLMKMGAAPFHFWFPEVIEGLSWFNSLLLLTWQKIAPMNLIMNLFLNLNFISIIIITSMIVSTIMALNQSSMRKIIAFSSINHIGWMLSAMLISSNAWMYYFLIYSIMNFSFVLTCMMNNLKLLNQLYSMNNLSTKMTFSITILSLGGIPPLMGFFPKWMLINLMSINEMFFLSTMLIIMTLILLFIYIKMILSMLTINTLQNKLMTNFSSTNLINMIILFGLMMCTLLTNLF